MSTATQQGNRDVAHLDGFILRRAELFGDKGWEVTGVKDEFGHRPWGFTKVAAVADAKRLLHRMMGR